MSFSEEGYKGPAPQLCVFEASERIGGRTYSVRDLKLENVEFVLDVGAYRFSPDMHLPGDLILHKLKLPTKCYEPNCPDASLDMPPPFIFNYSAPLRRIVDPTTGLPAGYVSAMERMIAEMKALGVVVKTGAELVSINASSAHGVELTFSSSGAEFVISAQTTMLNLARNRLFELRQIRSQLPPRTSKMLECVKFDLPPTMKNFSNLRSDEPTALTKAYFGYADAWWMTRLSDTVGEFPTNAFFPIHTSFGIYVGIRWSDGPVYCKPSPPANKPTACTGFLEVYYAVTNETYYAGLSAPGSPLGVLASTDAESKKKIEIGHAALMEAIAPILKAKGVSPADIAPPEQIIVGAWQRPYDKYPLGAPGAYTAPTKVYYSPEVSGSIAKACGVSGLSEAEYRRVALQPFGADKRVFMANNDWVAMDVAYMFGDWAEETLLQAERALRTLGMPKPEWLNQSYYDAKIAPFAVPAESLLRQAAA